MSSRKLSQPGPGKTGNVSPDSFHFNKALVDTDGGDCPEQEAKGAEAGMESSGAKTRHVHASVLENREEAELTNTCTEEGPYPCSVSNGELSSHSSQHVENIQKGQGQTSAHPCQTLENELPESPCPAADVNKLCLAHPNPSSGGSGCVHFQSTIIMNDADNRDSEKTQKVTCIPQEPIHVDCPRHTLSTFEQPAPSEKPVGDADAACRLDNTTSKCGDNIHILNYRGSSIDGISRSTVPCQLFNIKSSNTLIPEERENQASLGQDASDRNGRDEVTVHSLTRVGTEEASFMVSNATCPRRTEIKDATCLEDAKIEKHKILKTLTEKINENVDGNVAQSDEMCDNIVFNKSRKTEEVEKQKIDKVKGTRLLHNEVPGNKAVQLNETRESRSTGLKLNKVSDVFQITEYETRLLDLDEITENDTCHQIRKSGKAKQSQNAEYKTTQKGQEENKTHDQDEGKQTLLALHKDISNVGVKNQDGNMEKVIDIAERLIETQIHVAREIKSQENNKTREPDGTEPSQLEKHVVDKDSLNNLLRDTRIENSSSLKLNSNKIGDMYDNVGFDQGLKKGYVRVNQTKDAIACEPSKTDQNVVISVDVEQNRDSKTFQKSKVTDSEANLLSGILECGTQQQTEHGENAEAQKIGDKKNEIPQQIKMFKKETHKPEKQWENKTQLPNERKRKVQALREDFLKRVMPNSDGNTAASKYSIPTQANSAEELILGKNAKIGTFKRDVQDGTSTRPEGLVHKESESCVQLSEFNKHSGNNASQSHLLRQDECSTGSMNSVQVLQPTTLADLTDNGGQAASVPPTRALESTESHAYQKNIIYTHLSSQSGESPRKLGGRILSRKSQNIQRLQQQLQEELGKKNMGTSGQVQMQNLAEVSRVANRLTRSARKYKRSISRSCGPPVGARRAVHMEKRPYRQWQRVSNCLAPGDRFIVSAAPKDVVRIGGTMETSDITPGTNETAVESERQVIRKKLHGINDVFNNDNRISTPTDASIPDPEILNYPQSGEWHESQKNSERRCTTEHQGIHTNITTKGNSDARKKVTADPKETTRRYDLGSACVLPYNEPQDLIYVPTSLHESRGHDAKSSSLEGKDENRGGKDENNITNSVKRIVIRKEKELDKEQKQSMLENENPFALPTSNRDQSLSLSLMKERHFKSASSSLSPANNRHKPELGLPVKKPPACHHPDTPSSTQRVPLWLPRQNRSPKMWLPARKTSLSPQTRQGERNNSHPWTACAASDDESKATGSLGEARCVRYNRDSLSKDRSPAKSGNRLLGRYSRARSRHVTEAGAVSRGVQRISAQPTGPLESSRRGRNHRILNLFQVHLGHGSKTKEAAKSGKGTKYIKVKAREDYTGSLPGQLSFKKGQVLKQRQLSTGRADKDNMAYGYYRVGRLRKKLRGLFPVSLVAENLNDEEDAEETLEKEWYAL